MDILGDRIDKNTLDTVFSSFDELQEEYHSRLYELLRKESYGKMSIGKK